MGLVRWMVLVACLMGFLARPATAKQQFGIVVVLGRAEGGTTTTTDWKMNEFYQKLGGTLAGYREQRGLKPEDLPFFYYYSTSPIAVGLKLGDPQNIVVALCEVTNNVPTAVVRQVGPLDPYGDVDEAIRQCAPLIVDTARTLGVGFPYLGVTTKAISEVPAATLEEQEIHQSTGLYVTAVSDDTPAADAGLRVSDVLVQVDDAVLQSPADIAQYLRTKKFGSILVVTYFRANERKQMVVHL